MENLSIGNANNSKFLYYEILLVFKSLIFVFYFPKSRCTDIWILDIRNTKWYKSPYQVPQTLNGDKNVYVLKGQNNSIYLIDFGNSHRYKACLNDLIPNSLETVYQNYYEPLVIGYIKKHENKLIIPNIPIVIKRLIWKYFPPFL